MKNKNELKIKKNNPTIFPLGFFVGELDGEIVVIEFIDTTQDNEVSIINSFALTVKKARELSEALISACDNND